MLSRESKRAITILAVLAAVIVVGGILFVFLRKPAVAPTAPAERPAEEQQVSQPPLQRIFRYEGQEGRTALELLKEKYRVETKQYSGLGELVEAIDGVKPPEGYFWKFLINDQAAQVGASSYVTKQEDLLEWRIEKIK